MHHLTCPTCRLTLHVRAMAVAPELCPRCLARHRCAVPLEPAEEIQLVGECARLRLEGDFDARAVPRVDGQLDDLWRAGVGRVRLDLSDVTFMDSSALGLVLRWAMSCATGGPRLTVIAGDGPARRILEVTGVGGVVGLEGA